MPIKCGRACASRVYVGEERRRRRRRHRRRLEFISFVFIAFAY